MGCIFRLLIIIAILIGALCYLNWDKIEMGKDVFNKNVNRYYNR